MAKKSKKSKRRRHQLKKSRRGQVRKRRPKEPSMLQSDYEDDDWDFDEEDIPSLITVSRDVPVAEDGYRIVGPAQAMMDYAKPLMDEVESDEQMESMLTFAQMCWTLAVMEREDPKVYKEMRRELVEDLDMPEDIEDMVDEMIERYHEMFPDTGESPSFYIKERVIDQEEFEPFDESTLHITRDKFPPTREEIKLAKALPEIDPSEDEAKLSKWQDQIVDCYAEWCIAKGVPGDIVADFAYAVSAYLRFLSSYYDGVPSSDTPVEAVQEFMHTYYIRKTWSDARSKTVMPCAMKLYMEYLEEKGIVKDTQRIREIIESEQGTFQKNLKLYTDPSLGGKIIPFTKR